jgi:hypothetical protein
MTDNLDAEELKLCLMKLRDLRLWATQNKINPWIFRQMLIMAIEIDTLCAMERGIKRQDLERFDKTVKSNMLKLFSENKGAI